MNPNIVLKSFLESNNLQYNLASNSVLEWFGRTIKGPKRILNFLKYDIKLEYEPNFTKASECVPFEVKPTHLTTQSIPPENLVDILELVSCTPPNLHSPEKDPSSPSTSTSPIRKDYNFETPPKKEKTSPRLPPLTQGRTFMPLSDDEEDEEGERKKQENDCESPPQAKRSKSEEKQIHLQNQYSELMYLESIGTLRIIKRAKHRGVRRVQVQSGDLEASGTSSSQILPEFTEKRTKLKISYRIRNHQSQDIQFSLIIYEHMTKNPATRRNLMADFREAVELEDDVHEIVKRNETTPSKNTPTTSSIPSSSTSKKSNSLYKMVLNSSNKKKREAGKLEEKTPKKSLRF